MAIKRERGDRLATTVGDRLATTVGDRLATTVGDRLVTKVFAQQLSWEQAEDQATSVPVRIAFKRISKIGSGTFGVVNLVKLHSVTLKEGKKEASCKDGEIQEGKRDGRIIDDRREEGIDEVIEERIDGGRLDGEIDSRIREGICVPVSGSRGLCQRRLVKIELAMKTITVKRKDNRELNMLKLVNHPNVIKLHYYFFSHIKDTGETRLNLLFSHQPTTLYDIINKMDDEGSEWDEEEVAEYTYQMAAGVEYLHSLHIVHRDIKPRNLLVRPEMRKLQVCDLGSAIRYTGQDNLSAYICSRFYRAPELLLGSSSYSSKVDVWSMACVMAELLTLQPLLAGDCNGDQLVEVMSMLGPPRTEDLHAMRVEDEDTARMVRMVGDRQVAKDGLRMMLGTRCSATFLNLMEKLLVYNPARRLSATELMQEHFFHKVRRRRHK